MQLKQAPRVGRSNPLGRAWPTAAKPPRGGDLAVGAEACRVACGFGV